MEVELYSKKSTTLNIGNLTLPISEAPTKISLEESQVKQLLTIEGMEINRIFLNGKGRTIRKKLYLDNNELKETTVKKR